MAIEWVFESGLTVFIFAGLTMLWGLISGLRKVTRRIVEAAEAESPTDEAPVYPQNRPIKPR